MALPVKGLEEALLRYLKDHGVEDAVEISSLDEDVDVRGGCETCGPEYNYSVDIHYYTSKSEMVTQTSYSGRKYSYRPTKLYTTSGKFGDLIQDLTDEPDGDQDC